MRFQIFKLLRLSKTEDAQVYNCSDMWQGLTIWGLLTPHLKF